MYASFDDSDKYHIMLADRGYTHCGRQAPRRPWVNFSASPPAEHTLCQYCQKSLVADEARRSRHGMLERKSL
jgi:hypothetical protein